MDSKLIEAKKYLMKTWDHLKPFKLSEDKFDALRMTVLTIIQYLEEKEAGEVDER